MKLSVQKVCDIVNGKLIGSGERVIQGVAGLGEATDSDISFLKDPKSKINLQLLEKSKAAAIIVPQGFTHNGKTLIQVDHPLKSFSRILELIDEEMNPHIPGIHPLASIDSTAKIGSGVKIGPFCVIEKNAEIGDNVNLVAHVYIGHDSVIGKNTKIYPSVIVRENILIGSHCTIHAGTIIGSDGYGYYFSEGQHNKIHQVGKVIIEDNVEIGSCTTIDRATTGATLIKKALKLTTWFKLLTT
jgi:UDP-3-O-[3-hydroxymyristoyl] glucosamine N-acyltransferase